jgi:hypothetical protein
MRHTTQSVTPWLVASFVLAATAVALGQAKPQVLGKISVESCTNTNYKPGLVAVAKTSLCAVVSKKLDIKPYQLETLAGGRTLLSFPNTSKVTLFQKSTFVIDSYSAQRGFVARLTSGQLQYSNTAKGVANRIYGPKTTVLPVGTRFEFTVGAAADTERRAPSRPKAPAVVWKRAAIDLKKVKVSDVATWRTLVPEACTKACGGPWKPNDFRGEVKVSGRKLRSTVECGCWPPVGKDSDKDGVPDQQDSCPKVLGQPNAHAPLNGCPLMLERVVLLKDPDGGSGTLELRANDTNALLATLDKPFMSAGVTPEGVVVLPETPEDPQAFASTQETPSTPATMSPPASSAPEGSGEGCYFKAPTSTEWQFVGLSARGCYTRDSCSGGGGQPGTGCYKWSNGPAAPAQPWGEAIDSDTIGRCFLLMRDGVTSTLAAGGTWSELDWNASSCYGMDSCFGGLGQSYGACYKWADNAYDDAMPWDLVFGY